jgi:hypothetical protein
MKTIPFFALFGVLFACGPATSPPGAQRTIEVASATNTPLPTFRTYRFGFAEQPPAGFQISSRALDVEQKMRDLVAAVLQRKGFEQVDAKSDFVVRLSAGTLREEVSKVAPDGVESEHVLRGEIVINAYDSNKETQLWHGAATAVINPDRINDARLQTAVEQIMSSFPPRTVGRASAPAGSGVSPPAAP